MQVRAQIDLTALRHNLQVVKKKVPQAQVMAMIKANAYGHDLLLCARALDQADFFGVATLTEALRLRKNGITHRLVVLSGFKDAADLALILAYQLDTVVFSRMQIDLLQNMQRNKQQEKIKIWLKIDTGMHRLGCALAEAEQFLHLLEQIRHVEVAMVMSHLACADEKDGSHSLRQIESFEQLTRNWAYPRSLLNSAGILAHPDCQYEVVRPGLILYGASPLADVSAQELGVQPVMSLSAQILALTHVIKGEGVGYGQEWVARRNSIVATVSIGYAEGYPQFAHHAVVLVQGKKCPIAGRVSMNYLAVDVTDVPGVKENDMVLLWGQDLPVNEVARLARTSPYSMLTSLMAHVNRIPQ